MSPALLLLSLVLGADPPPAPVIKALPSAGEAQAEALANTLLLAPVDRPFVRYVWVQSRQEEDVKEVSRVLNWLGYAPIYRPRVLLDKTILIQVDLRRYVLDQKTLDKWVQTWEEFTFDPNFSLLLTQDVINLLLDVKTKIPNVVRVDKDTRRILVTSKPYVWEGKTYTQKWVSVIRQDASPDSLIRAQLEQETGSTAPVVHSDYFLMRAQGSIRDREPFTTIFGGLYYEFAGVRTAKEAGKKKATDLDQLMEDLGIVDNADVTKFQAKFDRLGSDQRVGIVKSKVTGKPRLVYLFPTLSSIRERGVLTITQDRKDDSIDVLKNPFKNLLDYKPDALEAIWVRPNGAQGYALFNDKGARQDEVPFDVANDSTIPDPYTKRLSIPSCWICHAKGGRDGWQPIPNEVRLFTRGGPGVITDISDRNKFQQETIALLDQKYAGNADDLISELRRGTIRTVLRATGPWKQAKDQTEVARLSAERAASVRNGYWYSSVSAKIALKEMGYDPGQEDPMKVLRILLPPDVAARNDILAVIPEDASIKLLLEGKEIGRTDWELVKAFASVRARQVFAQLPKKGAE